MRQRLLAFGICVLVVLLAQPSAAQTGTGRIVGVVKDATGGVVPGAIVRATHEPTGITSETVTKEAGGYVFPSLSVGPYTLVVELQGFATVTSTKNVLTVGSELRIDAVLHPGGLSEAVTVTETAVRVQTTESSLSTLVPGKTIETLPLNGRNPLHLIGLVPGVVGHSAEATSSGGTSTQQINGDRGRGITTTQDGIDIADPVIPRGELTNAPINPDALQEFRVITSNAKAEYGRSAGGQIELVTRAGTNRFKGTAYAFLRDTSLDSNSYFNDLNGLPKEILERKQFGASFGGPIKRNRAFFFFNYDGTRRLQETSQLITVPTESMRNGEFRFVNQACAGQTTAQNRPSCVDASGNPLVPVSSYSLVANDPRGLGVSQTIQKETLAYQPKPNDFTTGDGLNYAGYRWNSPTEGPVDTLTTRIDVQLSSRQSVFGRYSNAWRNDLINDIINTDPRPLSWPARVRISDQQGLAAGHKMTIGSSMVNEVTGGFTYNILDFADPQHPKTYEVCRSGCIFGSPRVYWPGSARKPLEMQVLDNFSWVRGSHTMKTGTNMRWYRITQTRGAGTPFGIYPSFTFSRLDASFTGNNTAGVVRPDGTRVDLTASGINATDRNNLNTFYNIVLGRIGKVDQAFYSDGTGFPPLNPLVLDQRTSEYNFYVQDDWRVSSRLTFNLGLRYELNTVPYDASGAQVINDRPLDGSQGPVTFLAAGKDTGLSWFKTDKNNFAPSAGMAWDPRGDGKMAIRASYRLAYQRLITWALNVVEQRQPATSINQFLTAPSSASLPAADRVIRLDELLSGKVAADPQRGIFITMNNGVPLLTPPTAINRTPANIRGEQPLGFDPNITTPYMQQWSASVQREIPWNLIVEAAYVGTKGTGLFRMMNVNQMDLLANNFIRDFSAARRNLVANGNPNIGESTGNFGRLYGGTIPTTVYADITNNNLGLLADALDRGTQGIGLVAAGLPDTFFRPSPQFTAAGMGCSCSSSRYDALQLQLQRRYTNGLAFAANYTLAYSRDDVSADTRGAGTEMVVPSDPKRLELDKARSDFDVRHVFRAHAIYELPFGKGRKFLGDSSGLVDALIGGWSLNTIVDWSSGYPLTVFSGYHTFSFYDSGTRVATESASGVSNRSNYTGGDTIGRVEILSNGSVQYLSSEERAMFSTPAAGETGSKRNPFTGPGFFQADLGVFKNFSLPGKVRLEARIEIFNVFNTVNFANPTILGTSGTFGMITGTRVPPRIVQLGVKAYF